MATKPFANPPASGLLSDLLLQFKTDYSQNANSSTVQLIPTAATATGYKIRLVANDTVTQSYDGGAHVRVHLIGFDSTPAWFAPGNENWLARSVAVPSGFSNTEKVYAGDEVHGGTLAAGSAPFNGESFKRGDYWRLFVRGGTSNADYQKQHMFGRTEGGTLNPGVEYEHNWVGGPDTGGNKLVVLDERVDFLHGFYWDDANGWYEAWARWPGSGGWVNIVPRMTGIPTSYPDFGGPYMSLYYNVGSGGSNALDVYGGYWGQTKAEVTAALDAQLLVSGGGGPSTFGNTTAGSVHALGASNGLDVFGMYTPASNGTVTKLTVYASTNDTNLASTARAVIYTDNAGAPNTLVAVGTEATIAASSSAAWYDFPISASVTAGTNYWLGLWYKDGNISWYYVPGGGHEAYKASVTYSSSTNPITPFGSLTASGSDQYSVYATFTPSGGGTPPSFSVSPSITGTAKVGSTLTGVDGTVTGSPAPTVTRSWYRAGIPIPGATASTYLLAAADDANTVTFRNDASNASGSASAISSGVAVTWPAPTTSGSTPGITGTAQVGITLTAVSYAPAFNGGGISYAFQWKAAGVVIPGATAQSYTPQVADIGKAITYVVTATNDGGTASQTSSATANVVAAAASSYQPAVHGGMYF